MICSHHTNHDVIFKAEPWSRSGRLDTALVLITVHDLPPHFPGRLQGFGEHFLRRRVQDKWPEIGIGLLLLGSHLWATVLAGFSGNPAVEEGCAQSRPVRWPRGGCPATEGLSRSPATYPERASEGSVPQSLGGGPGNGVADRGQ